MLKRKIIQNTSELKKEIHEKHENGARVLDLVTNYGIAKINNFYHYKNIEKNPFKYVLKDQKILHESPHCFSTHFNA